MTLTTPFVPRALEGFALSRMTVGLAVRGHRGRRRAQPVHQPQPAVRRRAPGAASPRRLLLLLLLADGRAAHARGLAAWQVCSSQQLEELAKAALLAVMRAHAYPRVHHPCGGGHPDGGAGQDPSKDYRERLFKPPEQSGHARGHASRLTLSVSLRGARLSEHLKLDYKGVSGPELDFRIAVWYGNAETALFPYWRGLCEAGVFRKSRRAGSEPIVTRLSELRAHLASDKAASVLCG